MAYVRITSLIFPEGTEADGARLLGELNEYADTQPGHIIGMTLRSTVNPRQFLRMSMWHNRQQADHASTADRGMLLRARLNTVLVDGHHREDSFELMDDLAKLRFNLDADK